MPLKPPFGLCLETKIFLSQISWAFQIAVSAAVSVVELVHCSSDLVFTLILSFSAQAGDAPLLQASHFYPLFASTVTIAQIEVDIPDHFAVTYLLVY